MRYQLFSDLDQNFGIHFIDEETEEITKEVLVDPTTGAKFDRNTALAYAEKITNTQDPKTKQEFFERFSDEDFANYLEAVSVAKGRFASEAMTGDVSARTKEYAVLLSKFEIRPDFNLSEQDLKTIKNFCKEFNITALPTL